MRSEVLRHLSSTEHARWAGPSSSDPPLSQFTDSIRELETAAIIARVPRRPLVLYVHLASAARNLSDTDVEEEQGWDESGGIEPELSRFVRTAASEVSRLIWSPWLVRAGMSRRSKHVEQMVFRLDALIVAAVKHVKEFRTCY